MMHTGGPFSQSILVWQSLGLLQQESWDMLRPITETTDVTATIGAPITITVDRKGNLGGTTEMMQRDTAVT